MTSSIPLLWLPGLLCDETLFAPVNGLLLERVKPICAELQALDSMAALAKDILDSAPDSFILGGLSMGGILAFEVYRQAPERVKGMILLDTNSADEKQEVTDKRNLLVAKAHSGQFSSITPDHLLPVLIHPERAADTSLTGDICQMAENIGVDKFASHAQALATRPDAQPLLSQISVPSLIICGRDDLLCPIENHLLMDEMIANSALVVIEQCGHLSTLEKPKVVADAINRWIQNIVF
ncbi:alpha/beta fold hydrolase [Vibrio marisflavi]|uniref:2-succinyl-6-hydroxy-2, 4-cyclohexadiene-1-carboxylate synthase n=1 Tax=Vibrio marisflavi CECT 7928 TaxID=634439 RepID=A0ABM8ZZS8_9VIBR|nr:alpha/beta hydrolase [Vibrio marisflavi]CAH0536656.1 2-succinyl-6-hydroxy-2, 4-cyclohexadiene-1-carboxylate synthase [Vibrio marisflavi CECT 7928]